MYFLVTVVVKPLAGVSAIVDAGSVVVGKGEPYTEDPRTGERMMLQRERGTYTMDVGVDSVGVMGVEDEVSQGSTRQA